MTVEKDNLLKMAISNHFFSVFQNLKYRGIEVARYLFFEFINHLYYAQYDIDEILKAIPGIRQDVTRAEVFSLVDGDYPYTVRPGKKILNWGEYIELPDDRQVTLTSMEPALDRAAREQLLKDAEAELEQCRNDALFGSSQFKAWFQEELLLRVVDEIDQYAGLFDREEIGCVVTQYAYSTAGRMVLWLAKSRGIPSIAYQPPLMIGYNDKSYNWWPVTDIPIVAAYKTVWGQQYKEFFMSFGVPASRLPVIGNPYFDRISSYQDTDNAEFRQKYGIPSSHKIVLHPTQYNTYGCMATVKAAVDAVKTLPDTTLLIKTRDNYYPEEREIYRDIIQDHPRIKILDAYQPIYDLIANSDVVLVFFSNCGVEAMLFGKPVVIIDVKLEEPPYSYVKHIGVPEARNRAELAVLLRKLFTDPKYNRKIRAKIATRLPYLCLSDGKAIHRMTELIMKVSDGEYLQ